MSRLALPASAARNRCGSASFPSLTIARRRLPAPSSNSGNVRAEVDTDSVSTAEIACTTASANESGLAPFKPERVDVDHAGANGQGELAGAGSLQNLLDLRGGRGGPSFQEGGDVSECA